MQICMLSSIRLRGKPRRLVVLMPSRLPFQLCVVLAYVPANTTYSLSLFSINSWLIVTTNLSPQT